MKSCRTEQHQGNKVTIRSSSLEGILSQTPLKGNSENVARRSELPLMAQAAASPNPWNVSPCLCLGTSWLLRQQAPNEAGEQRVAASLRWGPVRGHAARC